ncbi:MAG: glyoxalase [Coprobacillus sp.]
MKYCGSLYVVKNKENTIEFYKRLFQFRVIQDFGTNFTLTGGISFQTHDSWKGFIEKDDLGICYGGNNGEIYIETEDLDEFIQRVKEYKDIQIIHDVKTHEWGHRGMRFYDPDLHIIEVSETLPSVCRRFHSQGMTNEDISKKTGLSIKMVARMLHKI